MPSDGLPKDLEPLAAGDPATIGPYVLAGQLGNGGMGTVYLGRTAEKGTHVAIKVIRPELAFDEATRARFHDEMENARRVASFCTAKVLDYGTFEGRPYMVTEYISGTALAEHVAEHGSLDSSTLHGFALGVAAALSAIHRAGLVHRDLKPANVLLSLSGPRVIDFGIARAMNTVTNHTQTGIVMGSPGWMAPEQLLEEKVTTAADVFAWGCLVAFAGNGVHPFGNGDAMTLGKRMLFAEPQIGNLDAPLDRLVTQALAKKPEHRPKAQDLLLELTGGEDEANNNGGDQISHALHQSWHPNLPPVPPPPQPGPPGPPPTPAGMPHPPPSPAGQGPPLPQYPAQQPPVPGPQPPAQPAPHPNQHAAPPPAHQTGQFNAPPVHQSGPIPQVGPDPHEQAAQQQRPQPYVPPAPPPPQRPLHPAKRRLTWIVVTAGVAIVLVGLLVTALTLFGSNGLGLPLNNDQAPQDTADQDDAGDADADGDDSSGDGSGGSASGENASPVEFDAREYSCVPSVDGRSRPEGGMYCVFSLEVRNVSSEPVTLESDWQRIEGGPSGSYTALEPSVTESEAPLWQQLSPRERAEGDLVFLVEENADLESGELLLSGAEDAEPVSVDISDIPQAS
ncbi:serine/threonine protein kinase [Haloactinospora alba]|uniref:Serine/threonine protein kinase n=1 Tax=Haloactinospora alba TaxID=405555 RepID=A0A543NEX3_9ACTN|nr:serine/threonine-protein kinase [Haloactinospora alba]TQN30310.1 serine/threonine protein kinase [Haloactinospora alba]